MPDKSPNFEHDKDMQEAILNAKAQAQELRKKLISGAPIDVTDLRVAAPANSVYLQAYPSWLKQAPQDSRGVDKWGNLDEEVLTMPKSQQKDRL